MVVLEFKSFPVKVLWCWLSFGWLFCLLRCSMRGNRGQTSVTRGSEKSSLAMKISRKEAFACFMVTVSMGVLTFTTHVSVQVS